MEWRVTVKGTYRRGREAIIVKPVEGQRPTDKEWEAMKNVVEQAVKKASS